MNKTAGYLIMILGLLIILINSNFIEPLNNVFPESLEEMLTSSIGLILGIGIIIIGVFLVYQTGGKGKTAKEVPIYRGKKIVGYRRH